MLVKCGDGDETQNLALVVYFSKRIIILSPKSKGIPERAGMFSSIGGNPGMHGGVLFASLFKSTGSYMRRRQV